MQKDFFLFNSKNIVQIIQQTFAYILGFL